MGARYYDAQVGRFVSRDTYLDQHPYLYREHDGVNWVDPSGHGFEVLGVEVSWGTVGSVVGGAIGGGVSRNGWGIVIGTIAGRLIGGHFDGENWGDAAKASIVDGAVAIVGGKLIGPIRAIRNRLFPAPVIDPISRNPIYRIWRDGSLRKWF